MLLKKKKKKEGEQPWMQPGGSSRVVGAHHEKLSLKLNLPCLHGLVVWGPGFTVMATLCYLMSLSGETLREIIPELNRICFEWSEMSRARLCRRSPPLPCCVNNGKASCLSVGQGCTSPGFHLQMNSWPWWKCWGAAATMKGIHREMQFVNQLVC